MSDRNVMLSSIPMFFAMMYSGRIEATAGIIRVDMKKNRPSRHLGMRAIDSAYAAGMARMITRIVETTDAVAELMKYGAKLRSRIARYWSSVGVKKNVGGSVDACASCFRPVRNIQSTGEMNSRPTTHAVMPIATAPPLTFLPRPRRVAAAVRSAVVCGVVATAMATHASSWNRLETTRSTNVAITIVAATTMTPAAADWPTSKARNAFR